MSSLNSIPNWRLDLPLPAYLLTKLRHACISPSSGIFFLHLQNILKTQFYFPLFELIKFSVNRKCSIFCHLHEKISLGVHISSLTVFGYTLQYFLFIISFLPVTPAAN
jgi:hypothetical protein